MLVVSSPSGAGKTTLCDGLRKTHRDLRMSVSVTTRYARAGEIHGENYYFVSIEEFKKMQADGELLESACVFGNHYGTPKGPVEQLLSEGKDILFDVDWQGASQLSQTCGDELCRVFILPPSAKVLEERLRGRGTDSSKVIAQRMSEAAREVSHWSEYDYIIINDDLQLAQTEINAILIAERAKKQRMLFLQDFVDDMLANL
ncbi:MAG: guanylate kinase [bacterium]|nr:guanylate kinase [bacterium]